MKADRFTKSVLAVIAVLLAVVALRPPARGQQAGGRNGDLSQLQVSRLADGRLFVFDAATGDLLELAEGEPAAGGVAPMSRVGTLRPRGERGWEVTRVHAAAGRVVPQRQLAAARVDMSTLETALDLFEIDAGRFPTTEEGLAALAERPDDVGGWAGPYVKRGLPRDPWGNEYVYASPGGDGRSFELKSPGPDGKEGGGDDIDSFAPPATRP